jgi:hypothetical protein
VEEELEFWEEILDVEGQADGRADAVVDGAEGLGQVHALL